MKDLRDELFQLKVEFGVIQQDYCTKDEEEHIKELIKNNQPIPDDIHTSRNGSTHFRYVNADISKEEQDELLVYRQTNYLKTIMNCMIFFVILALIPIVLIIFTFLNQ